MKPIHDLGDAHWEYWMGGWLIPHKDKGQREAQDGGASEQKEYFSEKKNQKVVFWELPWELRMAFTLLVDT